MRTFSYGVAKANCSEHILHNIVKFAPGNLNVDIENIVINI